MKSLVQKIQFWIEHHDNKAREAEKLNIPVLQSHHADHACMARQILEDIPSDWIIYQLECVRIVDMDKQVDSLGLFFDIDEVKEVLTCYQKQRESQGFKVIHAADNGLFVDLHWENDQGYDQEVSLTISPLTVQ